MYRCQMVWRKKKMRHVVIGCLGISVVISLVLVICSMGNTRIDLYQSPGYRVIYDQAIVRGNYIAEVNRRLIPYRTQVNEVRGSNHVNRKSAGLASRRRHQGNDETYGMKHHGDKNETDDEGYEDYGDERDNGDYYQDTKKDATLPDNSFREIKLSFSKHRDTGRVIDDNTARDDKADYEDSVDYDDDTDDKHHQYANPPFKRGDFDYKWNNSRSGAFKLHYDNVKQSNDSQRYNAGQYKSMHLLEDRRNMPTTNNKTSGDTIYNKRTQDHNIASNKDAIGHLNLPKSINSSPDHSGHKSSHIPKPARDRDPHTFSTTNFGYRKDGVSYPGTANILIRDRIETQIPIQTGGIDLWMLQEQPATQIQMPELPWQPGEVRSPQGVPLIVDKIYWSQEVEDLIATGIKNEDFEHFLHRLQTTPVQEMHAPQWNRCGRPSNQYLVLRDGTPLCARFRDEHVKLLHGELLSFYLARILGLDNVPIVTLSEVNSTSKQWRGMNLSAAGWNESSIVALIQWIDGLESERSRVKMPSVILEAYEKGTVFGRDHPSVYSLTANNLTEIVQWSDLILFDYLTGHYDRVASMQDGADREKKPSIMHENIRNLRKVWQTGKLWLIDNESGLFDGYELLYHGGEMGRKFVEFHEQMLVTNCVFRRQTIKKILQLARLAQPHEALITYTSDQDALYHKLPRAKEMILFQKYFHVRLKEVVSWIQKCQNR